MMTAQVTGIDELVKKLDDSVRFEVISKGLKESAAFLAGWSVKYRLSGQRPKYLDKVTSFLANSILINVGLPPIQGKVPPISIQRTVPQKSGSNMSISWGSNMPYAAIHEYGGKAGRNRSVNIPARPYMRPSIENDKNMEKVETIFVKHINRALQ